MSILGRLRSQYRPIYGALGVGTVVTLFVLLVLQGLPFFTQSELTAYDFQFNRKVNQTPPSQVVIVGLDQASIDNLNQNTYPIPRKWMARAVTFLHHAGARAIGLDFLFIANSQYGSKDDRALIKAIKNAGNVVVASELTGALANSYVAATANLLSPIDPIGRASAGVGLANVPLDSDSKVRGTNLMQFGPGGKSVGSRLYPSLAVALASVALHKPVAEIVKGLPRDHMLINYVGSQSVGDSSQQSFDTYQFSGLATGQFSRSTKVFRNKIVLVVPAAIITKDILDTPYGSMYGGYIQANILKTILDRDPITPIGGMGNNLIILLMGLFTTVLASRLNIYRGTSAILLLAVAYVGLTFGLFNSFRVWIDLVTPLTALVLVYTGIMALRFSTEERQRRRTNKVFSQYVTPQVVDIIVKDPVGYGKTLAGTLKDISVLFVDIRGFTRMTEQMRDPTRIVALLNIYLEELTTSVQNIQGTVGKYVGDELMAWWNAPVDQPDHALRAVRCGVDMVARLDSINEQLEAQGFPAIKFGIGVNTGPAVVGQMGSSFKWQYDMVGDTVNTGARLCSAAEGGEIIIGEETWRQAGDRLIVEPTEQLHLKGKSADFRTFYVLAVTDMQAAAPAAVAAPA